MSMCAQCANAVAQSCDNRYFLAGQHKACTTMGTLALAIGALVEIGLITPRLQEDA